MREQVLADSLKEATQRGASGAVLDPGSHLGTSQLESVYVPHCQFERWRLTGQWQIPAWVGSHAELVEQRCAA